MIFSPYKNLMCALCFVFQFLRIIFFKNLPICSNMPNHGIFVTWTLRQSWFCGSPPKNSRNLTTMLHWTLFFFLPWLMIEFVFGRTRHPIIGYCPCIMPNLMDSFNSNHSEKFICIVSNENKKGSFRVVVPETRIVKPLFFFH